jgi:glutamate-ammonia-ligase adenylyltransferase
VILAGPRTQELFCRIAPRLLQLISVAPDPDMALINFERCTASIGARKVMYELFSEHPRTLELFVDLCAWSQFLTDILVRSPGMMDQIMDYLMVGRRKSTPEMEKELNELVESVEDPLDELLGYKDQEMLRIGIRDIIGEAPLLETMQDLANLAEATLRTVWRIARAKLQSDAVVRLAVIGCGKLGGQEMSYSSDLDVIFVYEAAPGVEDHLAGPAATRLAQQILNMLGEPTNRGKLYPVDPRLRPTGRSGSLVISLASFWNYFQQSADLWEFQAMTRARLIACDEELRPMLEALLPRITYGRPWRPAMAKSVLKMRGRLETAGGSRSIKRGFGGIVDIEFATQMLLLKHAVTRAELRSANTFEALKRIYAAGLIDDKVYEDLSGAYLFLRLVEDRLRIVNNIAEEELPTGPAELDRLAKRLGYMGHTPEETRQMFIEEYSLYTRRTRELFLDLVEIERQAAGEEWGPQDTRLAGTSRRM